MYGTTGGPSGHGGLNAPQVPQAFSPFIDQMGIAMAVDGSFNFSPGSTSQPLGLGSLQTPPQPLVHPGFPFPIPGSASIPPPPAQNLDTRKQKKQGMQAVSNFAKFEHNAAQQKQRGAIMRPNSAGMYPVPINLTAATGSASHHGTRDRESNVYPTNFASNIAGSMQPGSGAYPYESPMLSVDFHSRPLSPPQSKNYNDGSGVGMGLSGDYMHKQRKAESVLSSLQGAERHESLKKRPDDTQGSGAPRLFAPVDNSFSLNAGNQSAQQPGQLTNLILSNRLSSSNMGRNSMLMDDSLDISQDPALLSGLFSPNGDFHRSLVGESPKMGQGQMMFPYPSAYLSHPTHSAQTWQFPHHQQQHHHGGGLMNLSTPAFPAGNMVDNGSNNNSAMRSSGRSVSKRGSSSAKRSRRADYDENDDDGDEYDDDEDADDETSKPRRKKKAAKPSDPNEPKITSKHRGVCWYKRTKKWVVQTKVNGKRVHVGYFDDEEKAAEAYKKAVQGIQIKKALEAKQRAMTPGSDAGPPALEPGLPIPDAPQSGALGL